MSECKPNRREESALRSPRTPELLEERDVLDTLQDALALAGATQLRPAVDGPDLSGLRARHPAEA